MPVALHHTEEGPPDAPAVLLGGALGTTTALFDHLASTLRRRYRVVRFDHRGHGSSPAPPGPYTASDLAGDVVSLADRLGVLRFGYVGLSIGGAVGLTLALEHGDRLDALVLACTAPRFGTPETWRDRAAAVRADGLAPLVPATTERWFTSEFRAAHPDVVEQVMSRFVANPVEGYAACCEANATYDVTGRLGDVAVPTRVVVAEQDAGAPPDVGASMAEAIPAADLLRIDHAAHLANLAQPEAFDAAVGEHLGRHLAGRQGGEQSGQRDGAGG
jgi:3-oxoadipate enol-lactonase